MDSIGCRGIAGKARKAISEGEDPPMPMKNGEFRPVKGEWTDYSWLGSSTCCLAIYYLQETFWKFPQILTAAPPNTPTGCARNLSYRQPLPLPSGRNDPLALDIRINIRLQKCPE